MSPFEFQRLAERLLQNEKNPAGFRSAISRAYYAAFLTALSLLEDMGVVLGKLDLQAHKNIPLILKSTGDDAIIKVGEKLEGLRTDRNDADYKMKEIWPEEEGNAEGRVLTAQDIMAALNTCRTTKGKGRYESVADAARKYADFLKYGSS